MSTWQIILAIVAFSCIAALFVAAVMGRMNDITETEVDEPLGDMVDIRSLINKYED
jgi:hypothetical protein